LVRHEPLLFAPELSYGAAQDVLGAVSEKDGVDHPRDADRSGVANGSGCEVERCSGSCRSRHLKTPERK
jgi:hypothetical protein